MKKQVIVLVLAAVLVFGCAVGGTLALLIDSTDTVVNTFTAGNVNITLTETDDGVLGEGETANKLANSYKMVPGNTIEKDPTVTVLEGSEACWLFVKIEESSTLDDYITYTVDSAWTQLMNNEAEVEGVYYIKVDTPSAESVYSVLTNDEVTVNNTVTKAQLDALSGEDAEAPTLSFTAYAIQQANVADDAYSAWTAMQNDINNAG